MRRGPDGSRLVDPVPVDDSPIGRLRRILAGAVVEEVEDLEGDPEVGIRLRVRRYPEDAPLSPEVVSVVEVHATELGWRIVEVRP